MPTVVEAGNGMLESGIEPFMFFLPDDELAEALVETPMPP